MKFLKPFLIFLIINLGALGLGIIFMGNGPVDTWYVGLTKAPWTPPNWVFGSAWTFIMICFSFYMAWLYQIKPKKEVLFLFLIQFILNVLWNLVFFNLQFIGLGFVVIALLTIVIALFFISFLKTMKLKSILILPYLVWICIATSLNFYILLYN